jgi:hypothetical protein
VFYGDGIRCPVGLIEYEFFKSLHNSVLRQFA